MAIVRKTLLQTGTYQAPQGTLRATPKRVRAWAEKFRAMREKGIKVPVCWGHHLDALPAGEQDRKARPYYLSRYNAGYLDAVEYDPVTGRLDASLDVPGAELDAQGNLLTEATLPNGHRVKCAIGEVSAAIRDWTDGTGKRWDDSLVHVALVTHPVVAGQGGFHLSGAATDGNEFHLSLSGLVSTLATDSEDNMADELDTAEGAGADEGTGGKTDKDFFEDAVAFLKARGINLPEHTTADNFFEHLAIAGHALDNQAPVTDESPAEEQAEEEKEGEDDVKEITDDEPPTEEQRPVMMSLATAQTAAEKKLILREQTAHRQRLNDRINALVKRGLPPAKANEFRGMVAGYTLSLDTEGEVVPRKVDTMLSLLEEVLPKKKFTDQYLRNHAVEAPRPGVVDDEETLKIAQQRAAAVSRSN